MGVYIDMEMPKEGFVEILIRENGTVQQTGQSYRIDGTDYYTPYVGEIPVMYKAVPVPPHRRLIDSDELTKEMRLFINENMLSRDDSRELLEIIADAPTIIPADGKGTDVHTREEGE